MEVGRGQDDNLDCGFGSLLMAHLLSCLLYTGF